MAITTSDIRALREIEQILGKKEAGYYKDQTDPNYLYITTKIIKLINPLFPYKNYTPGMDLGFWMPVDPRTLIIGSNIYKSAVSTYQAMVGLPEEKEYECVRDTISDLVAVGFSGMKVVSDGANLTLARVSPQSISTYIDESGTKFYKEIHTFKESTSGLSGSASVSYALERIFFVGYNQVKLYRLTNQVGSTEFTVVGQSSQIGTEVPLSSTLLTKNMQEIERTGLTFPAFSYLGDKSLGFFPEIISLVNAIDRNITMIEATFMAHAEPWMIMRNIQIPSHAVDNMTGKIAPEKLTGRVLSGADGDASIDFATPSLENITIEMEHISSLTRQAYAIMNIPEEFQGIEVTSSAKGMGAQALKQLVFHNQIKMYRDTISDAFEDLLGIDLIWEESVAELDTFLTSLYAPKGNTVGATPSQGTTPLALADKNENSQLGDK